MSTSNSEYIPYDVQYDEHARNIKYMLRADFTKKKVHQAANQVNQ